MEVWVAVVSHDYGVDILGVFEKEETARKRLAKYCRDWWSDIEGGLEEDFDLEALSDERVIQMYFDNHPDGEQYELTSMSVTGEGNAD